MTLKKTVTHEVEVDSRIADLVYFAKRLAKIYGEHLSNISDKDLIAEAEDFWDSQHGED